MVESKKTQAIILLFICFLGYISFQFMKGR